MITFSQTGGTSGITTISVSATSTQNTADTVSNYTLSNENGFEMPMPVVQRAFIPVAKYITITPSVLSSPFSGGYKTITINSNDDWSIDSDEWITISITGGTSGSTIVPVMIEENTGTSRNGTIKCACVSDHSISANTIVNQEGSFKPYINLGYYVLSATSESATTSVTVSSNISWNVITDSRWVTVNTLSGSNDGSVSFTIAENTSAINREGSITVFNTEYDIYVDLVIRQSASVSRPYIKLSPNSFSVPYEGSTGNTISVSANCGYDIEADVPWIAVNAVSGSGNGSVSFSTSAMTGSSVGNIVFSNSSVTEYATVETVFMPYLSASTNTVSSPSSGGSFEVYVYSNVNWSVSVDMGEGELSTPWMSVTPVSGSNDGSIRISVASGITSISGSVYLSNSTYGLSWNIQVERAEVVDGTKFYYTTTGNTVLTPYVTSGWGANIVSNTYQDGQGVITFDNDITTIPKNAFYNKLELDSVLIPNTVTTIGDRSFQETSLTGITIPKSIQSIGKYAFRQSDITITEIHYNAISANTVGQMWESPFGGTNYPERTLLVIGDNVRYIPQYLFMYHHFNTDITIPSSVVEIGDYAFYQTRFTGLSLPDGIVLGDSCFFGDEFTDVFESSGLVLRNINIPQSCFTWRRFTGDLTISNCTFSNSSFSSVGTFNTITVDGVTTNALFSGSSIMLGCKNTIIPSTITEIYYNAFYLCTGLTSIVIPSNVKYVDNGAFMYSGLRSVSFMENNYTYSSNEYYINATAFKNCSNLSDIYFYFTNPPKVYFDSIQYPSSAFAFYGVSENGVLHVPVGATSSYETWLWYFPNGWTIVDDL